MNNTTRTARVMGYLRTGGARTIGYILAVGVVAGVAARVSYSHIQDVALFAGQKTDVAALLPLAVDGMLMAASLAMADDKAKGREPRLWARFGFWFGAVISLACNAASTVVHSTLIEWGLGLAIFVSMLAPALLLITVEIIVRPGKTAMNHAGQIKPAKAPRTAEDRLKDARKRASYDQMSPQAKADWTRRYNERTARTAPTSGAPVEPGSVPTDAELHAATA